MYEVRGQLINGKIYASNWSSDKDAILDAMYCWRLWLTREVKVMFKGETLLALYKA